MFTDRDHRLQALFCRIVACAALVLGTASIGSAQDGTPRDNGFTILGDYSLSADATLILENGTLRLGGDYNIAINSSARYDMTTATLQLIGLPQNAPQAIEVMAEDNGGCGLILPDRDLYTIKTFRIGQTATTGLLVDNHVNSGGLGREAMYVENLVLDPGTTLDLGGLWLYYDSVTPADPYAPGSRVRILDSVGGGGLMSVNTTPPEITEQPTSTSVCAGGSLTLSVTAVGAEPLSYQWRLNGLILPDGFDREYVLDPAEPDDFGIYDVIVFNDCGLAVSDSASVQIWPSSAGDVNGDTFIDGRDIGSFMNVILNAPDGPASLEFCAADIDASGHVDETDMGLFVTALLGL